MATRAAKSTKSLSSGKRFWIQEAIKRPGALRARAKREGALTKKGTISKSWLLEKAKAPGRLGRQARLAITLSKLRKRRSR